MTKTTRHIWTRGYFPFTMGGSVWRPMTAECEVTGPHDLGKGFEGYLAFGPDGMTKVAEAESGAIVGDTLDQVRADIAATDDVVLMQRQVEAARKEIGFGGVNVTAEEFWRRMRKAT